VSPFVLALVVIGGAALLILNAILRGAEELRQLDQLGADQVDNVIDLEAHR
jgi:hypothetical protein